MKYLILFLLSVSAFAGPFPMPSPSPLPSRLAISQESTLIPMTINNEYDHRVKFIKGMIDEVWANPFPRNLTPQQVFDSLGAKACIVHQMFLGEVQYMNAQVPGSITFTEPSQVNECGTGADCVIKVATPCPSPSP